MTQQPTDNQTPDADRDFRYVIGIDLGTTNSAVAYVDLDADDEKKRSIEIFRVPQLVGAGEVADRSVLPSFLYLPGAYDLPPGSARLPWDEQIFGRDEETNEVPERDYIVGEFAREQGADVPDRLVSSAKSWLSHAGADRTAGILPWGAQGDVEKVSPVLASMRYLRHVHEAWDSSIGNTGADDNHNGAADPEAAERSVRFAQQLIVLTVPASFDEVARELTLTAAREAGLPNVVLLEEPLAAFYSWLSKNESTWQEQMNDGQIILVCDVGGGTTDLSIVGIREGERGLRFDRLAVGEHLMLGGDNMDLTLGRFIEMQLKGRPGALDAGRWHQLVHQCRKAKEQLLNAGRFRRKKSEIVEGENNSVDVTLMGEAGALIAGTMKATLTEDDVQRLILDGFFPQSALDEMPQTDTRSGLTELGLPYVQDPAVTRHLAAFWARYADFLAEETGRDNPFPDFLLYNGGTLAPTVIRDRISEVVQEWFAPLADKDWSPTQLSNPQPDLAVALGAAYYGLVRLGKGVRVGSGTPRSYYVGIGGTENAGLETPAVCLVPRGSEEGFTTELSERTFEALTNQPVSFQLYTSNTRLGDKLGDVVALEFDEMSVLPQIQTVLRYGKKGAAVKLPVQLAVTLTEIGTLELWCRSLQSDHRWQLQFDVRQLASQADEAVQQAGEIIDETLVEEAQAAIRATFAKDADRKAHPAAGLRKRLETLLDLPKEKWPTPLIRKMADALLEESDGRHASADHEARWLNLLGFCLRPGFGDPLDEWRMKQVWKLSFDGLKFPKESQNRSEWWVFWRRVAGGLKAGQQMQMYQQIRPHMTDGGSRKKKPSPMFPKRPSAAEELEIWMALANFEWLTAEIKVELGGLLLKYIGKNGSRPQALWALSRLGARAAAYGPLDRVISGADAAAWMDVLLKSGVDATESAANALVHLTRYTGDRARDLPEADRDRVAQWLHAAPNATRYLDMLANPNSDHTKEAQDWIFGDVLPAGLVLVGESQDT